MVKRPTVDQRLDELERNITGIMDMIMKASIWQEAVFSKLQSAARISQRHPLYKVLADYQGEIDKDIAAFNKSLEAVIAKRKSNVDKAPDSLKKAAKSVTDFKGREGLE